MTDRQHIFCDQCSKMINKNSAIYQLDVRIKIKDKTVHGRGRFCSRACQTAGNALIMKAAEKADIVVERDD